MLKNTDQGYTMGAASLDLSTAQKQQGFRSDKSLLAKVSNVGLMNMLKNLRSCSLELE